MRAREREREREREKNRERMETQLIYLNYFEISCGYLRGDKI